MSAIGLQQSLGNRSYRSPMDASARAKVDLSTFENSWYSTGRSRLIVVTWYFVNILIFMNPLIPFYGLKRAVLRLFGAQVGKGVVIKPRVSIKYPWKVEIGDHTWIGEGAWLDSLDTIKIGSNCCLSQAAYLCTGSHDWSSTSFDLMVKPIVLEDGSWVCCRAQVMGGVTLGSHAIVTAGSVLCKDAEAYKIYQGVPAKAIKDRRVESRDDGQAETIAFPRPGAMTGSMAPALGVAFVG